jgi:methyl halide transferase
MNFLDSSYWDNRYKTDETGWDIGAVSPPLKEYFDQLNDKKIKILIPGAGNAYEAEYLFNQGFENVFLLDFSQTALNNFKERVPGFPSNHIICDDFFNHSGSYDLIIEQTFFCAINPELRKNYVDKCFQLLNKGGKMAGLLFDDQLNADKPPFGGCKEEYNNLFSAKFDIIKLETAYNSIAPRAGRELFFIFRKQNQ